MILSDFLGKWRDDDIECEKNIFWNLRDGECGKYPDDGYNRKYPKKTTENLVKRQTHVLNGLCTGCNVQY